MQVLCNVCIYVCICVCIHVCFMYVYMCLCMFLFIWNFNLPHKIFVYCMLHTLYHVLVTWLFFVYVFRLLLFILKGPRKFILVEGLSESIQMWIFDCKQCDCGATMRSDSMVKSCSFLCPIPPPSHLSLLIIMFSFFFSFLSSFLLNCLHILTPFNS